VTINGSKVYRWKTRLKMANEKRNLFVLISKWLESSVERSCGLKFTTFSSIFHNEKRKRSFKTTYRLSLITGS